MAQLQSTVVSGNTSTTGFMSAGGRRLSMGILDLNSGGTPTQIRIDTTIPFVSPSADFTVNIKGFRYGAAQMVSLSIGWHYYADSFFNRTAICDGAWAPTITLARNASGNVVIHLAGPGYWHKLYVESLYSSAYTDSYASGWSWSDTDLSNCTYVSTVNYQPLATSITGNSATTSQTNFSTLTLNSATVATQSWVQSQGYVTGGPYLALSGGTMTGLITSTVTDEAFRAQSNGTSTAWRGRLGSFNSTADKSSFLGNYTGRPGVFGHNNALTAWAELYVNTLGIYGQGDVYLSWFSYVKGNGTDTNFPILHSGNFSSYAVPVRGISNWNDGTVIDDVIGLLAWKNYGGGHVIFDASQGTAPNGTSINNTNPQNNWTGTYPTLMGWNGSNTYGVRVDSARVSDSASSVPWAGISAGVRTNYTLRFQPSSNDYAGFEFNTSTGGGAGYFLVRGTSDNDVYTAEGITLVADAGWLTLAQRTSSSRGVRIMTGTGSTERARFLTDGTIQFVNGAGFTYNGNTIWHAGNFTPGSYLPLSGGTMTGALAINSTAQAFTNITLRNTTSATAMPTQLFLYMEARYNSGANGTNIYHWIRDSWEYNITNNYSDITLGATGSGTTYVNLFRVSTDGQVYATNSFRAPIFVDSQNTTFYGDFAGQSVIHSIQISRNGPYSGYNDADLVVGNGNNERRGYGQTGGSNIMLRSSGKSSITVLDENHDLGQISYQNLVWTIGENVGWGAQRVDFPGNINVTGNVTSTSQIRGQRNQSDNNYTTAALWTESYGTTTTGIAFHISNVVGKFLEMRTNGVLYWENAQVWTSANLTNLNQLSNGPGYVTGGPYLPLSGGSMSGDIILPNDTAVALRNAAGNAGFRPDDQWGNTYTWNTSGGYYVDATSYFLRNSTGSTNWMTISSGTVTASSDFRAPIFYDSQDTGYYVDPNSVSYVYEHRTAWRQLIGNQNYDATLFDGGTIYRPGIVVRGQYPHIDIVCTSINNSTHGGSLRFSAYDAGDASSGNFKHWVIGIAGTNATGLYFGYSANQSNPHYGIGRGWSGGNDVSIMWILNDRNVYMENGVYANIFYDRSNTNYYLDPGSTTSLRTVGSWRSDSSSWDGEFSGKIQYHSNHWYFQSGDLWLFRNAGGSNVFSVNQSGSGTFSGTVSASNISTGVNGSHIVQRDGAGYIYANYINFNTSESENSTINSFITSNGDGWSRKASLQHAKNSIRGVADGTWGINITGNAATLGGNGPNYYYPGDTPNGYATGDINGNTTHQRLWGTDSVQNLFAFRPPTSIEYSTNGSTWISTSATADLWDNKIFGKWGGFNMNVGNNIGAWRFVRMTWVNFGYHFFSNFTLAHSTNGHSFNFVFYKSDLNGNFGAEAFRMNGISSWPGYTFVKHSNVSGWWDTRDIRIVFELNHNNDYPNNAISIGHIGLMGSYSGFTRLYDWDASRNMFFANNVNLNGSLTVGSSTSSDIYMVDTDEGTRRIHCNSHRIGFLNQSSGWGSYCNDDGSWSSDQALYGPDIYTTGGWFRNHTNNNGIYWSQTGWHLLPHNSADFRVHSGNSSESAFRMETNGTTRGYVYVNSSNEIGFLNSGRSWIFRMSNNGNGWITGNLGINNQNPGAPLDILYSGSNVTSISAAHSGAISSGQIAQGLALTWSGYGATFAIVYKQGELSPSDMCHIYNVGGFYMKIFDGSSNRFHRWDDNGTVSINSSSQGSYIFNVTGDIYATADVIAFSDARVKEDVRTVENALDKVTKLRGVTYIKKDEDNKKRKMGVIAQEVLEILPEVVHEDNNGYYGVSYGNIVGVLIEAIKEQQKQIDELKQELKNK